MAYCELWSAVGAVFVGGFALQAWMGVLIYTQAPPIPDFKVVGAEKPFITNTEILDGQNYWQSIGGMQLGSVWGHGALQAPDWSAEWLHMEIQATMDHPSYTDREEFIAKFRSNSHTEEDYTVDGVATISPERYAAYSKVRDYYIALFTGALKVNKTWAVPAEELYPTTMRSEWADKETGEIDLFKLRNLYNMKQTTMNSAVGAEAMCKFFFWTSWASSTERKHVDGVPQKMTYTNNWPYEPLINNSPTADVTIWSMISVGLLLIGVFFLYLVQANEPHSDAPLPSSDPLAGLVVTPSMASIKKWTWVMFAVGATQITLGIYIGHLTVNDDPDLSWLHLPQWMTENITYTVARTWHVQSAVFFVAGSFLGSGLFLAPIIGGRTEDPPLQKLGADFLFVCILFIVVGSFLGELLAVHQWFDSFVMNYWFGHQGYEYIDLGRFYQYFIMVGLLLWLALMINAVWPAVIGKHETAPWHLTMMLVCSMTLIGFLYASGFLYDSRTHLTIMEYWRWWVVHIWVEGVFEIFTTIVIAFVFVKLGVYEAKNAVVICLSSTAVFMFGGIPGMFHHNYWNGTTTAVMAVGAVFSALEVVPLTMMAHEVVGYMAIAAKGTNPRHWLGKYTPIVKFFMSVAFWNFLGAGVFGFMINPPISLYYTQCTYLVQTHGHCSLWGVYGVLGMALCLLVLRLDDLSVKWDNVTLEKGMFYMNVGMFLMAFLSMLPIGIYQFWDAMEFGYWHSRSQLFHDSNLVNKLKLARALGDVLFAYGLALICWVVLKISLKMDRVSPVGEKSEPLMKYVE